MFAWYKGAVLRLSGFYSSISDVFDANLTIGYSIALAVSLAVALIVVWTNGNVEAAMAFVVAVAVVFTTFYKVEWGFYMFFAMVMLFDQFLNPMPFGIPFTEKVAYFDNLNMNPFIPSFSAGVMNPLEIQMALILLAWFISVSSRTRRQVQGAPYWGFAILLFLELMASELYGLHGGGDFLVSLWEIRALMYFLLLYFLVPQVIQTKEQISVVLWIFIAMITVKALQGDIRFIRLGFKFDDYTVLTNHEDPMFMADLFILLIGYSLFDAKTGQRRVIFWLLPVLLMGFYSGQRRACYAGFFIALGTFIVMLNRVERKKFFRAALPIFLFLGAYTAIFWNYNGRISEPIQLVKSGFSKDASGAGERFDSNLYREFERYDLAVTVRNHPVIGTGFGQKYMRPAFLVNLGISLQDWIPHDQIFWLMVNMGAVGFFIFFLFINALMFESGKVAGLVRDPFLKAVTLMIGAMIVNQMVVSYFDMQLTWYRDMVFMGTFSALLPTITRLSKETSAPSDSTGLHAGQPNLTPETANV